MKKTVVVFAALILMRWNCCAAETTVTPALPPFQEVFNLFQTNLAGVTPTELDEAATRGLLGQFEGRAFIVTNAPPADSTVTSGLTRSNVFDNAYGYIRFGRVVLGAEEQFRNALQTLQTSNKLNGLVIDLRYARGTNYAAAVAVADQFLSQAQALLNVQDTVHSATAKQDAIRIPLAILVNRQTAGAPEALVAVLRQQSVGLVIGSRTAGQAMIYKDFPLSNGQQLRMGTAYLKLADGGLLPSKGLKPDIEVEITESDEKTYFEDPYAVIPGGRFAALAASRTTGRMINEAELVRRHREGLNPDEEQAAAAPLVPQAPPQVRDPVLGRALDLLKGLAVVHKLQ